MMNTIMMQQMYLQQQNNNNLNQLVGNQNNINFNDTKNSNNISNNFNNQQKNLQEREDNEELVQTVKTILQNKESEERTEMLGETLFYFLLNFIGKHNLNVSNGKFDDTFLCSKLTGILMHTNEDQLVGIIKNSEILKLTIQDVIRVNIILKYLAIIGLIQIL